MPQPRSIAPETLKSNKLIVPKYFFSNIKPSFPEKKRNFIILNNKITGKTDIPVNSVRKIRRSSLLLYRRRFSLKDADMTCTVLRKIENGDAISRKEFCVSCRSLIWLCGRNFGLNQQEQQKLLERVTSDFFNTEMIFVYDGSRGQFRDYLRQMIYRNMRELLDQRPGIGKIWLNSRCDFRELSKENDENKES